MCAGLVGGLLVWVVHNTRTDITSPCLEDFLWVTAIAGRARPASAIIWCSDVICNVLALFSSIEDRQRSGVLSAFAGQA